jgi:hypothetical protein
MLALREIKVGTNIIRLPPMVVNENILIAKTIKNYLTNTAR